MRVSSRSAVRKPQARKAANLMIRVDPASKGIVARAATLRGVSTSDYVREVVVAQARREVDEARTRRSCCRRRTNSHSGARYTSPSC